jgi:hypothetical protein
LKADTETAVAWQYERELVCSSCNQPRDESMAKEAQFAYRAKPLRCHSCKAIADAQAKFTAGPHDPGGLTFAVSRLDGPSVHAG